MKRNILIFIGVITGFNMQFVMGSQASKNAELAKYIQSIETSLMVAKEDPINVKIKYKRQIARATQLIEQGANVNTSSPNGMTLLMIAVALNLENLVKKLLGTPGINVNLQSLGYEGEVSLSALMIAINGAHPNIVKLLLNAGAAMIIRIQDEITHAEKILNAEDLVKHPYYIYEEPKISSASFLVYEGMKSSSSREREEFEKLKKSFPTLETITVPISDQKAKAKQEILKMLQDAKSDRRAKAKQGILKIKMQRLQNENNK